MAYKGFSIIYGVLAKVNEASGDLVIDKTIWSVSSCAFYGLSKLKSVKLPDTVEYIGASAFAECVSLEKVDIPELVTEINDQTFLRCESLKEINLPERVTRIGKKAFLGCSALTTLFLPYEISFIGKKAFYLCNLSVEGGNERFKCKDGSLYDCESKTLLYGRKIDFDSNLVKTIGEGAFSGRNDLTDIAIPYGVENILEDAFAYCENLTSVTIPASVKFIGYQAFQHCSKLRSVVIEGESVELERWLFTYCSSLEKVTMNKSLFVDKNRLAGPYVAFFEYLGESDKREAAIEWLLNQSRTSRLPEVEKYIRNELKCKYVLNVILENGSTYAFEKYKRVLGDKRILLKDVDYAVAECESPELRARILNYKKEKFTRWDIEEEERREYESVFKEILTLRQTYSFSTSDEGGVCLNRYKLFDETVVIPDEIDNRKIVEIASKAFRYIPTMKELTLPKYVKTVGDEAFSECSALIKIVVFDQVERLGNALFKACSSMKTVEYHGTKEGWLSIEKGDLDLPAGCAVSCLDGDIVL